MSEIHTNAIEKVSIRAACFNLYSGPIGKSPGVYYRRGKKIPRKFLEVILLELKKGGVLGSKQGKGEGYYLRVPSTKISLLDIIRTIDGAVAMLPCVSIIYHQSCGMCDDESNCSLHNVFSNVRDETLKILGNTFLHDVSKKLSRSNPHSDNALPWRLFNASNLKA